MIGVGVFTSLGFHIGGFGSELPGCGFTMAPLHPVHFLPIHAFDWRLLQGTSFGSSLIYVMDSYWGWNAASCIVEEVRDPGRALPRALILGTAFVLALYFAVNAVFL